MAVFNWLPVTSIIEQGNIGFINSIEEKVLCICINIVECKTLWNHFSVEQFILEGKILSPEWKWCKDSRWHKVALWKCMHAVSMFQCCPEASHNVCQMRPDGSWERETQHFRNSQSFLRVGPGHFSLAASSLLGGNSTAWWRLKAVIIFLSCRRCLTVWHTNVKQGRQLLLFPLQPVTTLNWNHVH